MFFKHLQDVNMNYFEHMLMSLHYAIILILSGCKALIHAFMPDIFSSSTGDCIKKISMLLNHNY